MKAYLIFLVSLFTAGSAYNFSCKLPENEESWYVLINDFGFGWVTRKTAETEIAELKQTENLIEYYLWTQENPLGHQVLILDDIASLKESNFNSSNPTRIIAHGFQSSHKTGSCSFVKDAYLKTGPHNTICIDYSKIAFKTYPTLRYSIESIGDDLGKFIKFLIDAGGMSMNDFVLASHSFGTHVAGFAGKFLKKSNITIPVIIACDPSRVLFSYDDCSDRLCDTDADFVETIQSGAAGRFGFYRPIGHATYYPNGGGEQPGCGEDELGLCAHLRSYKYLAEAIEYNDFPSKQCSSYLDAVFNVNRCGEIDNSLKMGTVESFGKKGFFYVPVNSKPPYGNLTSF